MYKPNYMTAHYILESMGSSPLSQAMPLTVASEYLEKQFILHFILAAEEWEHQTMKREAHTASVRHYCGLPPDNIETNFIPWA